MERTTGHAESDTPIIVFPKPPTPPLSPSPLDQQPISDPPPPYPSRDRRSRAGTTRSIRRALAASGDGLTVVINHSLDPEALSPREDGSSETTPLLSPRRRQRTMSHSTVISNHSMAHSVFSIFQTEPEDDVPEIGVDSISSLTSLRRSKAKRYFRPLWKSSYYRPLVHLFFINFPYALLAFVYLFVGTLAGTTLLIALPIGAVICWLNLIGARAFARGEISLQTRFHGPLSIQPPSPPHPIFSRQSTDLSLSSIESGNGRSQGKPSFLKNTYAMFTDQTSYQAIFYFLVIKPAITLFLTVAILVIVPISFLLVIPAPAALRAVKRMGAWQANIALEGLSRPQL